MLAMVVQAVADGEADGAGGRHAVHPPSRVADVGPLME